MERASERGEGHPGGGGGVTHFQIMYFKADQLANGSRAKSCINRNQFSLQNKRHSSQRENMLMALINEVTQVSAHRVDGGRIYLTIIEVADCRYQSHSCQAVGGYYSTVTAKTCVTLIVYTLERRARST